jgi:hypothetical protein
LAAERPGDETGGTIEIDGPESGTLRNKVVAVL